MESSTNNQRIRARLGGFSLSASERGFLRVLVLRSLCAEIVVFIRLPLAVSAWPRAVSAGPHAVSAWPHAVSAGPHAVSAWPRAVSAWPRAVSAWPHAAGTVG